jgi:hypothetical protein
MHAARPIAEIVKEVQDIYGKKYAFLLPYSDVTPIAQNHSSILAALISIIS